MSKTYTIDKVSDYHALTGHEVRHPLVSVVDLATADPQRYASRSIDRLHWNCYAVVLKQGANCTLHYGRGTYDFEEGTVVFIAPGQVIGVGDYDPTQITESKAILFHPDLLLGTPLAARMRDFHFFRYSVSEALHLSNKERALVLDTFGRVEEELRSSIDKHSGRVVTSILEMLLNYCERFYDRQFITRQPLNKDVLVRLEHLVDQYYASAKPQTEGTLTVAYAAEQLHLSSNYLGDLVKKETGRSAQAYLQMKLLTLAKERLYAPNVSVSEVAFGLGFAYPQHFTRFFKEQVGEAPGAWRGEG